MAWYRAGSITVTNGSPAVTGVGTDFVSNISVGEALLGPDGRVYEVTQVISATRIDLGMAYQGATASGQSYAVLPTQSFARDLALGAAELLNSFAGVRDGIGQGLIADGSAATPGIRFASDQDTGLRRVAANLLALVSGGVDGVFIDGAGRVGIGAPSGYCLLEVRAADQSAARIGVANGAAGGRTYHLVSGIDGLTNTGFSLYDATAGQTRLIVEGSGDIRPGADNIQSLGAGASRWSVIYAGTGAINTSDEREKQDIGGIPDEWLDAWGEVEWSRFKFRDAVSDKGEDARWHLGLIAQRVRDAFAARDLDATAIGLLCHDGWSAKPPIAEIRADDGGIITPAQPGRPAGDRWGLRYEECFAIEAAWQRRRIGRIEAALLDLSARVA